MSVTNHKSKDIITGIERDRITKVKKILFLDSDQNNDITSEKSVVTNRVTVIERKNIAGHLNLSQKDPTIISLQSPHVNQPQIENVSNIQLLEEDLLIFPLEPPELNPLIVENFEMADYLEDGMHDGSSKTTDFFHEKTDTVDLLNENQDYVVNETANHENKENTTQFQEISNMRMNISPRRKRHRRPENWKRNITKKLREAGEEYCTNGKIRKAKVVKAVCENSCKLKCFEKFTEENRKIIKSSFYKLTDTQKNKFYMEFTERTKTIRKRTNAENSRRKFTFNYYLLKDQKEKVCKTFFCNTLDISVRRIYYFHQKLDDQSLPIAPTPAKGKHIKKQTPDYKIQEVIDHINSFPVEESHFCRSNTKRKYLAADLSVAKMYTLYVEKCNQPVKEAIYRKVFNEQFNLSFHKPKKDVCDLCSEYKANINPSDDLKKKYEEHLKRKNEGNLERDNDRKAEDANTAVVTFDLQNIFSLPQAAISCLYYTSKLTVYNLTAHCNVGKHAVNATWDETTNGRSGDDIASALIKILDYLIKALPPQISRIILWSDSCVPQNKNSHMSMALIHFLKSRKNKYITEINQKFSEPGHGNVQEVDAIHSLIERNLRHQQIFSPLSLKRAFLKIQSNALKFAFLTMIDSDFLSYHEESSKLAFSQIPYSQVKYLLYQKENWKIIMYKTKFTGPETSVDLTNKTKISVLENVTIKHPTQTLTQKKN
ncbi:hypothetical protein ACJJTC_003948 [Scirpophaga incertulas]